jgi:hypothetical protein
MVRQDMQLLSSFSRANHFGVFRNSGLEVRQYRYYDKKNINLDLEGMLEDIKVEFKHYISNDRPHLLDRSYYSMLALITQRESIQPKTNGGLFPRLARLEITLYSLIWHISHLPREIPTPMLGHYVTLLSRGIRLHWPSLLQRISGFTENVWVHFLSSVNRPRRRKGLKARSKFLSVLCSQIPLSMEPGSWLKSWLTQA